MNEQNIALFSFENQSNLSPLGSCYTGISFTLDGALTAYELVIDSFTQVTDEIKQGYKRGDAKQAKYWHERIPHLMSKLN